MINSKSLNYIIIPLTILAIVHLFVRIPFAVPFLGLGYGLVALSIISTGLRFKSMKNQLVELGSVERFNRALLEGVVLLATVMLFAYFGPKIAQWEIFPARQGRINPYFITIIAIPQITRYVMAIILNGFHGTVYITEDGILFVMNDTEHHVWSDFDSYALLPDLKLIRFRKENDSKSDFFFVSYDDEDFNQNKEYILSILDKNLQREIE